MKRRNEIVFTGCFLRCKAMLLMAPGIAATAQVLSVERVLCRIPRSFEVRSFNLFETLRDVDLTGAVGDRYKKWTELPFNYC